MCARPLRVTLTLASRRCTALAVVSRDLPLRVSSALYFRPVLLCTLVPSPALPRLRASVCPAPRWVPRARVAWSLPSRRLRICMARTSIRSVCRLCADAPERVDQPQFGRLAAGQTIEGYSLADISAGVWQGCACRDNFEQADRNRHGHAHPRRDPLRPACAPLHASPSKRPRSGAARPTRRALRLATHLAHRCIPRRRPRSALCRLAIAH